jgi:hypothetical protein
VGHTFSIGLASGGGSYSGFRDFARNRWPLRGSKHRPVNQPDRVLPPACSRPEQVDENFEIAGRTPSHGHKLAGATTRRPPEAGIAAHTRSVDDPASFIWTDAMPGHPARNRCRGNCRPLTTRAPRAANPDRDS